MKNEIRKTLEELRDAVKRTVNLNDCGHADGVSLILVDAVQKADDVLNATAEPANVKSCGGGEEK